MKKGAGDPVNPFSYRSADYVLGFGNVGESNGSFQHMRQDHCSDFKLLDTLCIFYESGTPKTQEPGAASYSPPHS